MPSLKVAGVVALMSAGIALFVWAGRSAGRGADDDDNEESGVSAAVSPERPAAIPEVGKELAYNFDSDSAGALPKGFHAALTGGGGKTEWAVKADESAPSKPNVVAQSSADTTDYRFPLLIADEAAFRDLDLSVKFKAVSGKVDEAGGLIFRLKDANNYYVVRANALENNYRLYHVIAGRRVEFARANVKVSPGVWHQLRVEAVGNKITCYFDGVKRIEASDDTFKDAGKIGLWTKADSVTYFDDLRVIAK
jgi:hypothetical protein